MVTSLQKLSIIFLCQIVTHLTFKIQISFFFVMSAQSHFCNLSSDTTDFKQLCITTGCLTDLVFNIKINLFILFSILATIKPIISIIIYHPMSFDVTVVCKKVQKIGVYGVKWPQEKQACHSHDDAMPLSFWLQVTEDFFKIL